MDDFEAIKRSNSTACHKNCLKCTDSFLLGHRDIANWTSIVSGGVLRPVLSTDISITQRHRAPNCTGRGTQKKHYPSRRLYRGWVLTLWKLKIMEVKGTNLVRHWVYAVSPLRACSYFNKPCQYATIDCFSWFPTRYIIKPLFATEDGNQELNGCVLRINQRPQAAAQTGEESLDKVHSVIELISSHLEFKKKRGLIL